MVDVEKMPGLFACPVILWKMHPVNVIGMDELEVEPVRSTITTLPSVNVMLSKDVVLNTAEEDVETDINERTFPETAVSVMAFGSEQDEFTIVSNPDSTTIKEKFNSALVSSGGKNRQELNDNPSSEEEEVVEWKRERS